MLIPTSKNGWALLLALNLGVHMTENHARLRLQTKELEAMMWGLAQISDLPEREPEDPTDPLAILLKEGWNREAIMEASTGLCEMVYMLTLAEPLTNLEKAILRVCIENTSWVASYIQLGPAGGNENDARKTLRELAKKFEESFGIEVNIIANN
jgi:hypothetical protein